MRIDLIDTAIVRRLRRLDDGAGAPPYDWAEFQRRHRAGTVAPRVSARAGWVIAAVLSALVISALGGYLGSMILRRPVARRADHAVLASSARCAASGTRETHPVVGCTRALRANAVRTAEMPDWLAALPNQPVVRRLGTRVAESGLVNQIATVDALLSAARVSGARPVRLAPLVRRRRQLVSALAEVRYAEMLAAASQSVATPGVLGPSR